MKRKQLSTVFERRFDTVSAVISLFFFAFGAAVGTFSGSTITSGAKVVVNSLPDIFFGYINAPGYSSPFLFTGFSFICFIIILFLSLSVFGFIAVAPVLFIKGFSLSYSCAAILSVSGRDSVLPLFMFLLSDILICIPVLICVSVRSATCSVSLASLAFTGRCRKRIDIDLLKFILFCFIIFALI